MMGASAAPGAHNQLNFVHNQSNLLKIKYFLPLLNLPLLIG